MVDIAVDGRPSRLQPPDHLSADERQRFIAITANCDAAHFRPTDLPLLCRYVEADALAERAARELRKSAVLKNGKVNAWLMVQEKNVRALVSLSMRLRLSPQARGLDPKTLRRQPSARPSAYDTWDFGGKDDGGWPS